MSDAAVGMADASALCNLNSGEIACACKYVSPHVTHESRQREIS